jgi:hypothetical protein
MKVFDVVFDGDGPVSYSLNEWNRLVVDIIRLLERAKFGETLTIVPRRTSKKVYEQSGEHGGW